MPLVMSKSKLGLAIFSLGLLLCMPFTQVKAGISTFLGESDGLTGVYAFRPDGTDVSCRKADQTIITDISQAWPRNRFTIAWKFLQGRTAESKNLVIAVSLVARDQTMDRIYDLSSPPPEKLQIELGFGLHNKKAGEIDGKPFSLEGREDFIGFDIRVWYADNPRRLAWLVVAATNCTVP